MDDSHFTMIPHNKPFITSEDRAAVDAVLQSGWLAQGSVVRELEADFVRFFSGGAACAVSSGTASIFLALHALGVQEGDSVALPTYSCSALLNAVYMIRAQPLLVDILPDTFCLNSVLLASFSTGPKAAIVVNTYGASSDVHTLQRSGIPVIEDCCQSLGGNIFGLPLGVHGDISVFSFYATKIITGGQGGMLWSRSPGLVDQAIDYRQFDCREAYVPRFNLQMTDLQAALIRSQMGRLANICARRQMIATRYLRALPDGLSSQAGLGDSGRMPYRFVVICPNPGIRHALRNHLHSFGIDCAIPIEKHELLHQYLNLDPGIFPVAESLAEITLSLPIHLHLTDDQLDFVAHALNLFRV
jgi:perosamine synthetase